MQQDHKGKPSAQLSKQLQSHRLPFFATVYAETTALQAAVGQHTVHTASLRSKQSMGNACLRWKPPVTMFQMAARPEQAVHVQAKELLEGLLPKGLSTPSGNEELAQRVQHLL